MESKPGRIDYAAWAQTLHRWFYNRNIGVDFVHPSSDLSHYDLVVAPALYLLTKQDAVNFETFVDRGGTLLATYFSGIVDENEHVVLGGYPAFLKATLGLWVEEWCPYPEGRKNRLRFSKGGKTCSSDHWCDLLHLDGAESLASYTGDFFAGRPAFTRNKKNAGTAYYLGTRPDTAGLDLVLGEVVASAKIEPALKTPSGVEATLRENSQGRFLFLLNHTDRSSKISLGGLRNGVDLLSGRKVKGTLMLPPLDAAVIQLSD